MPEQPRIVVESPSGEGSDTFEDEARVSMEEPTNYSDKGDYAPNLVNLADNGDSTIFRDHAEGENGDYSDGEDPGVGDEQNSVDDTAGESTAIPDIMVLNVLCAQAKAPKDTEESRAEAEESWQAVREWLSAHDSQMVRAAAEQRGESGLTALHFACRNVPPVDVVDVFLSIAADTVRWPDSFGWLPIHYACASGSDAAVIQALCDSFPESKTTTDRRRRTPLHFALGEKPASPAVIFLLSSTGAASYPDEIGMLPLHYACAFGASEEILYVLTEAYPDAITVSDSRNRTPLHFALSNAGRKTVPAAVRLLLSLNKSIVNSINGGPLPLSVLAHYAKTIRGDDEHCDEKRESVHRCLEHLLHAEPKPTADFFTALQSLPNWLSDSAVVMPVVQHLLNEKISNRFPTTVLMLDLVFLVLIIVFYSWSVSKSLDDPGDKVEFVYLFPLYLGTGYFFMRELIQIISLLSLKVFKLWLYDPSNYLNVAFIVVVLSWTIIMQRWKVDEDVFRIGSAISVTIVWVKLLAYLRSMLIDFAVFVRGVFFVVRRLSAFLVSLGIILIAFAQMFNTIFLQTDYCEDPDNPDVKDKRCSDKPLPFCNFWDSFLSVYTMLLGEVTEDDFTSSGVATALFVIFMFLVVILLANVLIAIVTDSYKVIQDQKALTVFWTNRLDFVAEMDAIANGPWMRYAFGSCGREDLKGDLVRESTFGQQFWKQIMELYDEEVDESVMSIDFLAFFFLRLIAAFFLIPCWLFIGLLTCGWLWPPQVREAIFTSTVLKHSSDSAREDEQRKTQVEKLEQEVSVLREELLQELATDRARVVQIKSQVAERKQEIAAEMKQIKRLVTMLFERQSQFATA